MRYLLLLLLCSFGYAERTLPPKVSFTSKQIAQSKKIKHVIVIFQENWSFDALYGKFPNVDGLSMASVQSMTQLDPVGKPYPTLLQCKPFELSMSYAMIPIDLPNRPFNLQPYIPMTQRSGDLSHDFYQERFQINNGAMNQFATWSAAGGLTMSYYDISRTRMGNISRQFTICDRWFHSCYGGSMCGVLWLFSGKMPVWPNPSESVLCKLFPSGMVVQGGLASPDGFAVNDAEPFYPPYKQGTPDHERVPPQEYKTIGDLLAERHISWKWYAEGWDDAISGKPDPTFAFHHQAPIYFSQFAPGTEGRKRHIADLEEFYAGLQEGQVPSVSFIRSLNKYSQHPHYDGLLAGLDWCADLIELIQKSPIWKDCAIIVTYDENGGRWDHVSPPEIDEFGPGTRVPAIIISPFAKKNFVDHTSYETVSILKFLEERYSLPPLSARDQGANNILNAFDFSQP